MIWIFFTALSIITVDGQDVFNQLWNRDIFSVPNMLSKPDRIISLFDGRIHVPVPSLKKPEKDQKGFNLCITSNRQVGICTRVTECENFNLATLHQNICFQDIFVPGICCDQPSKLPQPTIPLPESVTLATETTTKEESDVSQKPLVELKVDPGCGLNTIPSSRIVQGERAEEGKWPWMAALYANTFLGRKFHCGGSLISDVHVLTGAHCVKGPGGQTLSPQHLSIRLGDSDISTLIDKINPGRFFSVKEIRAHPNFQNINHYFLNDVAVLKLNDKVTLSNYILPVCLPTPDIISGALDSFAGRYSTILGFGRTELGIPSEKLQEASVPIWKNKDCDNAYFAPITDIFICAGYKEGGIDACQGDSGGPMQIDTGGRWTQIGITSFGKGCGEAGFPGVYTRVSKFTAWIKENMI